MIHTEYDTLGSPLEGSELIACPSGRRDRHVVAAELRLQRLKRKRESQTTNGVEAIRGATRMLNQCREDFNLGWSVEQLILMWRAFVRSDFDVLPDRWTKKEITKALAGKGRGAESER